MFAARKLQKLWHHPWAGNLHNTEVQLITPPVIKVRAPMILGGSGGEIYTVFDEESESAVRIDEFLHPEEKIKKNQN